MRLSFTRLAIVGAIVSACASVSVASHAVAPTHCALTPSVSVLPVSVLPTHMRSAPM
ncbi:MULTISPECIES: hypothetical protein [unclassified Halomonas]|uniref:hypothetical protein n=1 Tax=unclassified Halomonas TaxID=2609666 RepID=UPI001C9578BD|nr:MULTISPECIES: hypothetical protein [unclassified Halomonas]MBY5925186.1 hypothetical protein [Halomonas sp. DP4Y7-2]MBY6232227.1 hypothetical protein [Halomonas sp. DP4Y7-1]